MAWRGVCGGLSCRRSLFLLAARNERKNTAIARTRSHALPKHAPTHPSSSLHLPPLAATDSTSHWPLAMLNVVVLLSGFVVVGSGVVVVDEVVTHA